MAETTVYQWYGGVNPLGHRAGRVLHVPQLLYVLGALLGDGCVYFWRGNFQVWLVGEEAFTAKFAAKISVCLGRQVKYYKYGRKNAWFVRVGNAELFFLLESVRKDYSLIPKLIREIDPSRGWIEFIEGLFDAEGCVKIIRGKERRTPKICLDFCNTDLALLGVAREGLFNLGIDARISSQAANPPRRASHHLRIYSKAGINRFLAMMKTTKLTQPKQLLFENWLAKSRWGKSLLRDFPKT